MNIKPLDDRIILFFNQFSQRSAAIDHLVASDLSNMLVKGGVITALFWYVWFRNSEIIDRDREFVLSGIVLSFVTLTCARALALSLPFRTRPRFSPELHFRAPIFTDDNVLINWSSFPSDHAALYFSLATCLFFISRRLGGFAYFHALVVVCLPRIYVGFHYPSDILAGALLGSGVACLSLNNRVRSFVARLPLRYERNWPSLFYPLFYLSTFLIASNFDPIRQIAVLVWKAMHGKYQVVS